MREIMTAIQGVCAWPNVVQMPDGELLAMIFNQPCHGAWEGDLDCWASADNGRIWMYRGRPATHEAGANRMNGAAGIAPNGDLIVLCSGWNNRGAIGDPRNHEPPAQPIPIISSRSSDAGRTWKQTGSFPEAPEGYSAHGPFGHILVGPDGTLRAAVYARSSDRKSRSVWMFRSQDGITWGDKTLINPLGNETDLLHLGEGRWLASSRHNNWVELFRSDDDGRTWILQMPLTLPGQVTSHLTALRDGRILLSYGNRCPNNFGVDVRVSEDQGRTWGRPTRLADAPLSDCGYPSTVQVADGTLVTAYYVKLSGYYHYEMRVVFWDDAELR